MLIARTQGGLEETDDAIRAAYAERFPVSPDPGEGGVSCLGTYIQDDWRINRKLTLNLGFRYEYTSPYGEKWGNIGYIDPYDTEPITGGKGVEIQGFESCDGMFLLILHPHVIIDDLASVINFELIAEQCGESQLAH